MFDSMIAQSAASHAKENKISESDYQNWQKLFSFDALRGKHYGQSFAEYFNITDYRIRFERSKERCDRIIRREWLVRA